MRWVVLVLCLLFSLATLQCCSTMTSVNDYFVAPDGSDAHDGSIDNPWRTPQYAAGVVRAGDAVILREGSYGVEQAAIDHLNAKDATTVLNNYTKDVLAASNEQLYTSSERLAEDIKAYYSILKQVDFAAWDETHINGC